MTDRQPKPEYMERARALNWYNDGCLRNMSDVRREVALALEDAATEARETLTWENAQLRAAMNLLGAIRLPGHKITIGDTMPAVPASPAIEELVRAAYRAGGKLAAAAHAGGWDKEADEISTELLNALSAFRHSSQAQGEVK